jgi:hypothetical protein
MKFLGITLIDNLPAGVRKSPTERLRDVVDRAVLFEELGSIACGPRTG